MLDIRQSRAKRARDVPRIELPVRILLALGGHPYPDELWFNVDAAARHLLAGHGVDRIDKVLLTFISAKSQSRKRLDRFVGRPLVVGPRGRSPRQTGRPRLVDFPGTDALRNLARSDYPRYDIVHFIGSPHILNGELMLVPDLRSFLSAGALRDALIAASCRLLVFQADEQDFPHYDRMAARIVESGGPSVLVAEISSRVAADTYFLDFYAGLLHAEPLSRIAAPKDTALRVVLHIAADGDREFSFDPLLAETKTRLESMAELPHLVAVADQLREVANYGHAAQFRAASNLVEAARAVYALPQRQAVGELEKLAGLSTLIWAHEGDGVIPLTRIADAVDSLEEQTSGQMSSLRQLANDLALLPKNAPRVLNANFADSGSKSALDPFQPLESQTAYDLLVDIGPRWDKAPSIVSGHGEFPADALPPDKNGHRIQIVFVSEEFDPHVATGSVWLPSGTGRSHPVVDGKTQSQSGPVALRVTTPKLAVGSPSRVVHGRLCLYFENNLLQSAKVSATVASDRTVTVQPNVIEVDFILTGGFRGIDRLTTRDCGPGSQSLTHGGEPIALNFALNDDGSGSHRILITSQNKVAWINYDPIGANDLLAGARGLIADCYWQRRPDGSFVRDANGDPVLALDPQNGKPLDAFKWDLLNLAEYGSKLFGLLLNNVVPPQGQTKSQWIRDLSAALSEATIIQIARTGPAQYVFPWGLVYDYPLPAATQSEYKFCRSINEWGQDGRRQNGPIASSCPHKNDPIHQKNVICPYGFWGLRHRIEQPPSLSTPTSSTPPTEASRTIRAGSTLTWNAALTNDATLDANLIRSHIGKLSAISRLTFAPPLAADWQAVCDLLKSPQVVYFLCHGEYDKGLNEPYLGVGLRDEQPRHRVYPNKLNQLFLSADVSPDDWKNTAPLIIINGCHTSDLTPGQLLDFVTTFMAAGASGVIGTEVSVVLPVAAEVGEMLFAGLTRGDAVTDAIRSMRWALANRGNLLGLAYTPYCFADLKVAFTP